MPSNSEHCQHTYDRYQVYGEDIHKWMDEPYLLYGPSHRKYRHDQKQDIPSEFIEKYGETLARDIMIDHIMLDYGDGTLSKVDINEMRYRKKVKKNELIIDLDLDDKFHIIWDAIEEESGNIFYTMQKREFKYKINDKEEVIVNKRTYPIPKGDIKKAFGRMPFARPKDISDLTKGSSYVWSLLHDDRIVQSYAKHVTNVVKKIKESSQKVQKNSKGMPEKTLNTKKIKKSCKTCGWAFFMHKKEYDTGPLGIFKDHVYTISSYTKAPNSDVALYCVNNIDVELKDISKINRFSKEEVKKIGLFRSPCDEWISKNIKIR